MTEDDTAGGAPLPAAGGWPSLADLTRDAQDAQDAPVAFVGAPLAEGSVTPGRCDLAPTAMRRAMRRVSSWDMETGLDLAALGLHDAGDIALDGLSPDEATPVIRERLVPLVRAHPLTILAGGNNAVTRPAVNALAEALAVPLSRIGLVTFDAHFDLRECEGGRLVNGNPVRVLIADGLPGRNIAQIGLQPFANTRAMHAFARARGIRMATMAEVRRRGIEAVVDDVLARLSGRVDAIFVDFDIDVVARGMLPGAPGARPGGMDVVDFFVAARRIGAHPMVRAVDLTEFDPALDVSDISALTAARWLAELLAGFLTRDRAPAAASA